LREHNASKSQLIELQQSFDSFSVQKEAELEKERRSLRESLIGEARKDYDIIQVKCKQMEKSLYEKDDICIKEKRAHETEILQLKEENDSKLKIYISKQTESAREIKRLDSLVDDLNYKLAETSKSVIDED